MPKRRALFALFAVVAISSAMTAYSFKGQEMQEIKFDLGRNIVETARASGVPSFSTENTNGSIFYSVNNIPSQIPVRFTRPGYVVTVGGAWAFTLYADHRSSSADIVETGKLQINTIASHEAAQAFVEQLLAQFQKGKWHRYLRAQDPAVTGRSSMLDEHGNLDTATVNTLDPAYKLSREDWLAMFATGKFYRWIGDGVIATLTVSYGDNPKTGVMYQIFLEFEQADVQQKRNVQAAADAIKEGEANGWNTAAKYAANKVKVEARNKLLEANALKRGDSIVPR